MKIEDNVSHTGPADYEGNMDMEVYFRTSDILVLTFHCTKIKYCSACCLLHAGFLLDLLFDPEDGGDMLLRNVGLCSRTQNSSHFLLWPYRPVLSTDSRFPGSGNRLQRVGRTPWTGDRPVARPLPSQDNTNTEKT
jgi:hypothetical protein